MATPSEPESLAVGTGPGYRGLNEAPRAQGLCRAPGSTPGTLEIRA